MPPIQYLIPAYLILINLSTFIIYGVDKKRAINNEWRIPEKTLILSALFGGSVGAIIGMHHFHHKTKHAKFYIGIPAILILHILISVYLLIYLL